MNELTPQQIAFLNYYNNPKEETFGNALQSAIKAGYSQEYAESLTYQMPDWLSENLGRRKRMLNKAENVLDKLLGSEDERIALDAGKFVAKTLGKNDGYSERTEHTGKDGEKLVIEISKEIAEKNAITHSTETNSEGHA